MSQQYSDAPSSFIEYKRLEKEWDSHMDLYDSEIAATYFFRSFAFDRASFINNSTLLSEVYVKLSEKFYSHLEEIDNSFENFKKEYNEKKSKINVKELLNYAASNREKAWQKIDANEKEKFENELKRGKKYGKHD